MKNFLLIFCFISFSISIYSQMTINDPQQWWSESNASIENIEIEVHIEGIYTETSIAFDLSVADPYIYAGNELLEFVFDFSMNENVIFNDSWLWINDYISVGEMYEQGEGTQIYESIVDRQQDPSILTQINATDYNLKVYPLKWDSTRRVRLSYLEPLQHVGRNITSNLPLELINESEKMPENIQVKIYNDSKYKIDRLNEEDWNLVESVNTHSVYKYNYDGFPIEFANVPINIKNNTPIDDYSLSTYKGLDNNYFQLVYYPKFDNAQTSKYNMILMDCDASSSGLACSQAVDNFEKAVSELKEDDFFMICYSDESTLYTSDIWIEASPQNIAEAFTKIKEVQLTEESQLSTLLSEALIRIEELQEKTKLIVLSSNKEYYQEENAMKFLDEIRGVYNSIGNKPVISFLDFSVNKASGIIEGDTYFGNDYVYQELSKLSKGVYINAISGNEIYDGVIDLFNNNIGFTDQFDFQITIDDGFTYGNFDNLPEQFSLGQEDPIVLLGKYIGEEPFKIRFSINVGGEIITDIQEVEQSKSYELDEMAIDVWNANYIKSIQHSGNQLDKRDVIELSIKERLLSIHTVFLCLEPETNSISSNNNGEGDIILISTEEIAEESLIVKTYPNPFINRLTIEVPIVDISEVDELSISILDSRGRLIDYISNLNTVVNGVNKIDWEPTTDLSEGIYIIQVKVNNKIYSQNVMKLKY